MAKLFERVGWTLDEATGLKRQLDRLVARLSVLGTGSDDGA